MNLKFKQAIKDQTVGYHVWSGSYGFGAAGGYQARSNFQEMYDAHTYGAETNGVSYQKAAGNDGPSAECATDPACSHYAVAIIAALDNQRQVTSYSTRSSSLLVSGFAGYGGSSASPGTCTISGTGSYTCNMNGTSAATPIVSGVVSLIKEAKTSLKWVDIHTILAKSADIINDAQTYSCGLAKSCVNHVVNSAGYRHSINSGFGSVNADQAVSLAKSWVNLPTIVKSPVYSATGSLQLSSSTCQTFDVNVDSNMQIYSLELSFDVSASISKLGIWMTMPDGKEAQIVRPTSMVPGNSLNSSSHFFKSMQALGVMAKGNWKFTACSESGTFSGVKMSVYGFNNKVIPNK